MMKNRLPPFDQLVGIHVTYLNDVEQQIELGEITDLIEFLSDDWAAALYHDQFGEFCRSLHGYLKQSGDELAGGSLSEIVDKLKFAYRRGGDLAEIHTRRAELVGSGGDALPGQLKRSMQCSLVDFLQSHASLLEMYRLQTDTAST